MSPIRPLAAVPLILAFLSVPSFSQTLAETSRKLSAVAAELDAMAKTAEQNADGDFYPSVPFDEQRRMELVGLARTLREQLAANPEKRDQDGRRLADELLKAADTIEGMLGGRANSTTYEDARALADLLKPVATQAGQVAALDAKPSSPGGETPKKNPAKKDPPKTEPPPPSPLTLWKESPAGQAELRKQTEGAAFRGDYDRALIERNKKLKGVDFGGDRKPEEPPGGTAGKTSPPGLRTMDGRPLPANLYLPTNSGELAKLFGAMKDTPRYAFAIEESGLKGLELRTNGFYHDGNPLASEKMRALLDMLQRVPANAEFADFKQHLSLADYERLVELYRADKNSPLFKDIVPEGVSLLWEKDCEKVDQAKCNQLAIANGLVYRSGKPVPPALLKEILKRLDAGEGGVANKDDADEKPGDSPKAKMSNESRSRVAALMSLLSGWLVPGAEPEAPVFAGGRADTKTGEKTARRDGTKPAPDDPPATSVAASAGKDAPGGMAPAALSASGALMFLLPDGMQEILRKAKAKKEFEAQSAKLVDAQIKDLEEFWLVYPKLYVDELKQLADARGEQDAQRRDSRLRALLSHWDRVLFWANSPQVRDAEALPKRDAIIAALYGRLPAPERTDLAMTYLDPIFKLGRDMKAAHEKGDAAAEAELKGKIATLEKEFRQVLMSKEAFTKLPKEAQTEFVAALSAAESADDHQAALDKIRLKAEKDPENLTQEERKELKRDDLWRKRLEYRALQTLALRAGLQPAGKILDGSETALKPPPDSTITIQDDGGYELAYGNKDGSKAVELYRADGLPERIEISGGPGGGTLQEFDDGELTMLRLGVGDKAVTYKGQFDGLELVEGTMLTGGKTIKVGYEPRDEKDAKSGIKRVYRGEDGAMLWETWSETGPDGKRRSVTNRPDMKLTTLEGAPKGRDVEFVDPRNPRVVRVGTMDKDGNFIEDYSQPRRTDYADGFGKYDGVLEIKGSGAEKDKVVAYELDIDYVMAAKSDKEKAERPWDLAKKLVEKAGWTAENGQVYWDQVAPYARIIESVLKHKSDRPPSFVFNEKTRELIIREYSNGTVTESLVQDRQLQTPWDLERRPSRAEYHKSHKQEVDEALRKNGYADYGGTLDFLIAADMGRRNKVVYRGMLVHQRVYREEDSEEKRSESAYSPLCQYVGSFGIDYFRSSVVTSSHANPIRWFTGPKTWKEDYVLRTARQDDGTYKPVGEPIFAKEDVLYHGSGIVGEMGAVMARVGRNTTRVMGAAVSGAEWLMYNSFRASMWTGGVLGGGKDVAAMILSNSAPGKDLKTHADFHGEQFAANVGSIETLWHEDPAEAAKERAIRQKAFGHWRSEMEVHNVDKLVGGKLGAVLKGGVTGADEVVNLVAMSKLFKLVHDAGAAGRLFSQGFNLYSTAQDGYAIGEAARGLAAAKTDAEFNAALEHATSMYSTVLFNAENAVHVHKARAAWATPDKLSKSNPELAKALAEMPLKDLPPHVYNPKTGAFNVANAKLALKGFEAVRREKAWLKGMDDVIANTAVKAGAPGVKKPPVSAEVVALEDYLALLGGRDAARGTGGKPVDKKAAAVDRSLAALRGSGYEPAIDKNMPADAAADVNDAGKVRLNEFTREAGIWRRAFLVHHEGTHIAQANEKGLYSKASDAEVIRREVEANLTEAELIRNMSQESYDRMVAGIKNKALLKQCELFRGPPEAVAKKVRELYTFDMPGFEQHLAKAKIAKADYVKLDPSARAKLVDAYLAGVEAQQSSGQKTAPSKLDVKVELDALERDIDTARNQVTDPDLSVDAREAARARFKELRARRDALEAKLSAPPPANETKPETPKPKPTAQIEKAAPPTEVEVTELIENRQGTLRVMTKQGERWIKQKSKNISPASEYAIHSTAQQISETKFPSGVRVVSVDYLALKDNGVIKAGQAGSKWLSIESAPGKTLGDFTNESFMDPKNPMRPSDFQRLRNAVDELHKNGVAHGDLHEGNIYSRRNPETGELEFIIIDLDGGMIKGTGHGGAALPLMRAKGYTDAWEATVARDNELLDALESSLRKRGALKD